MPFQKTYDRNHTSIPRYLVWLLVAIMPIMGFATDAFAPSLPAITQYLHSNSHEARLTISLFIFGFGFGQLFIGPLSDSFGRKRLLLISLVVYACASILAAMSSSMSILLLIRIIQGIASAGLVLNARVIAADCFHGQALRQASIYISTSWALSPIIGPAIGGYLQNYFGWQMVFYFLALYAAIMFVIASIFLPETLPKKVPAGIKRLANNYFHISLNLDFLRNTLGLAFTFSMINVFNVQGPFIIQDYFSKSSIFYAHIALLIGGMGFLGSLLNRLLMRYFSISNIIKICVVFLITVSLFSTITARLIAPSILLIIIPSILISFFCLMLYPNYSANCASMFKELAGTAAAYRGVLSMILAALITSIMSFLNTDNLVYFLAIYVAISIALLIVSNKLKNL